VFIAIATAICSLGHGLRTFTAVQWVNSALYPSGVTKSSTSFGWGKGWNATSVGWQVTLCDPIWHVSSRSGVAMLHCELLYKYTLLYAAKTALGLATPEGCKAELTWGTYVCIVLSCSCVIVRVALIWLAATKSLANVTIRYEMLF